MLMLVGYFGLTPKKKRATSELSLDMEVFFRFSTVK